MTKDQALEILTPQVEALLEDAYDTGFQAAIEYVQQRGYDEEKMDAAITTVLERAGLDNAVGVLYSRLLKSVMKELGFGPPPVLEEDKPLEDFEAQDIF